MQKNLRIMVGLLAVLLALSACQPTPEGDIVWNKGDGVLEEKIGVEAIEEQKYEAPDRLVLEPFGWSGGTVQVDAQVVVPEVDKWPVQVITKRLFTDQWAAEILDILAEGNPVYESAGETVYTRSQILEEIRLLQELIANVDTEWADSTEGERKEMVEGWESELEGWTELYKTAPETFEGQLIDPTSDAFAGWTSLNGNVDLGGERLAIIRISRSGDSLRASTVEFNSGDRCGRAEYYDWDSDFTNLNGVTISKEEAVEMGLAFMEKLGETGFAPAVVRAAYYNDGKEHEGGIATWPQAYYIIFTRFVEGVPTTYRDVEVDYGAKPLEQETAVTEVPAMTATPGANDTPAPQLEPEATSDPASRHYTSTYAQEYVEMMVLDTGVVRMYWREPATAGEILNENVELMSFEEIVERFKSQISYITAFMEESQGTLQVSRMQLGMMQVRRKNVEDSFLMIPVWTFYGTTETGEKDDWPPYPLEPEEEIVLILNAVDGSVVDLTLGY